MPKINSFTAIDFETANHARWSICSVGIVRVMNEKITDKVELLIQPPDNEYSQIHTSIHGITLGMTLKKSTFDKEWKKIKPFIQGQNVVAHNGHSFDFNCLKKTLEYYSIKVPIFNKFCTCQIYGAKLNLLCKLHKIDLDHHNALSDAIACAKLFLLHLKTHKAV